MILRVQKPQKTAPASFTDPDDLAKASYMAAKHTIDKTRLGLPFYFLTSIIFIFATPVGMMHPWIAAAHMLIAIVFIVARWRVIIRFETEFHDYGDRWLRHYMYSLVPAVLNLGLMGAFIIYRFGMNWGGAIAFIVLAVVLTAAAQVYAVCKPSFRAVVLCVAGPVILAIPFSPIGKPIWTESVIALFLIYLLRLVHANRQEVTAGIRNTIFLEAREKALIQTTAELSDAKTAAETANRHKSAFLANTSHEIRTPMNTIVGVTELLEYSNLDAGQRQHANTIKESVNILLRLIDDILDLSKIEAGKLSLNEEPVNLRELISSACSLLQSKADKKSLQLVAHIDDQIPDFALLDPLRMRQVIINIIGNAIKFTEKGFVTLSVWVEQQGGIVLHLRIDDTGVGLPDNDIERLFRAFERGEASSGQQFGGTGLGLAISNHLIRMMDGSMTASTNPRGGARFKIEVPIEVCEAPALQIISERLEASAIDENEKVKILVVDDNEMNRTTAVGQLGHLGYDAEIAVSGIEAIEKIERKAYDIIFMDIQMPLMDGYKASKLIRKSGKNGRRVKIVALTANVLTGERDKCVAAGMDDYLAKPLRLKALEDMLELQLGSFASANTPGVSTEEAPVPDETSRGSARHAEKIKLGAEFPKDVRELSRAINERDSKKIETHLHEIRQIAKAAGFHEIRRICEQLAEKGKNNRWPECQHLLGQLFQKSRVVLGDMAEKNAPGN